MIRDFQYSKISKMTDTVKLRFAMTIDNKYNSPILITSTDH